MAGCTLRRTVSAPKFDIHTIFFSIWIDVFKGFFFSYMISSSKKWMQRWIRRKQTFAQVLNYKCIISRWWLINCEKKKWNYSIFICFDWFFWFYCNWIYFSRWFWTLFEVSSTICLIWSEIRLAMNLRFSFWMNKYLVLLFTLRPFGSGKCFSKIFIIIEGHLISLGVVLLEDSKHKLPNNPMWINHKH